MTTIVTGFSPSGLEEYGRNFLETFDRCWPSEVRLLAFVEDATEVPRGGERSLWSCDGVREFIDRHAPDPARRGRKPIPGWRPKDRDRGYSYRFDAVKFCRQGFIPHAAALELPDGEVMAWLDGDVTTYRDVPSGFIDNVLGDADLCYLGRRNMHLELGFWAVRLVPAIRKFLEEFAELWRSDRVFDLPEWHSAFTFEHMISVYRKKIAATNMTPNGTGHVWFQSPLGLYTDHLKGEWRKRHGRSKERDSVRV